MQIKFSWREGTYQMIAANSTCWGKMLDVIESSE